jgi:hypothetical protein
MTRFKKRIKKFIKDYRLKDWSFMDFVCLALWAVLMVVVSLALVASIVIVNVLGFTHASEEGVLAVTIVIDFAVLFVVAVNIDNWLDERDRKKSGLSREEFYGGIVIR